MESEGTARGLRREVLHMMLAERFVQVDSLLVEGIPEVFAMVVPTVHAVTFVAVKILLERSLLPV